MRDENTVYIKYANNENQYGDETNANSDYYVFPIDSPNDLRDSEKIEVLDDGYVTIRAAGSLLTKINIKLADESREVKNFKMQ